MKKIVYTVIMAASVQAAALDLSQFLPSTSQGLNPAGTPSTEFQLETAPRFEQIGKKASGCLEDWSKASTQHALEGIRIFRSIDPNNLASPESEAKMLKYIEHATDLAPSLASEEKLRSCMGNSIK